MIVVDTNALVWFSRGNSRLGKSARRLIEKCTSTRECVFSAISIWEIAVVIRKRGLAPLRSAAEFRRSIMNAGVREAVLDGAIAARSEDFVGLHADPADRFILATADVLDATLVTSDEALLTVGACVDARV